MGTLYSISKNILDIFEQIEEADGEITDEQLKELEITENDLKEKLSSYRRVITEWESDIDACKKESKRLNDVIKTRNNRITKLKDRMLWAVNTFGNDGKTNKYIELPDCRISNRNTKSIEFDENRINLFIEVFLDTVKELVDNDILCTGDNSDIQGLLDVINSKALAQWDKIDEPFVPFTIIDFTCMELNISTVHTPLQLFHSYKSLLEYLGDNGENTKINIDNSKTVLKSILECDSNITFAKLINNQSLIIK